MFRYFAGAAALCMAGGADAAVIDAPRAMFARLISFDTSSEGKQTPQMAAYIKAQLVEAGFPSDDIEIIPVGDTAALIARWRGVGEGRPRPVAFLAHMDVVGADSADWSKPPFELTEDGGKLFGRGVVDNKLGVLSLVRAFIELKEAGFSPDRDLILAFTGDEETSMASTKMLAARLKDEIAFAVNSDAGGGMITPDGASAYFVQAAEKTYATFEVVAVNSGGHSSAPRSDNAIYDLATALLKIQAYRFPVKWNEVSIANFQTLAAFHAEETADALRRFAAKPGDKKAVRRLEKDPTIDRELRTTCVATMVKAGHAENALPQRATATVNCRIFPGETLDATRAQLVRVVDDEKIEIVSVGEALESPVSTTPPEVAAALEKTLMEVAPGAAWAPYQEAGGTDGLHFRRAGVATVGVGPIISTEGSDYNYHGSDENVPVTEFDRALRFYPIFIRALADRN